MNSRFSYVLSARMEYSLEASDLLIMRQAQKPCDEVFSVSPPKGAVVGDTPELLIRSPES
jgi:isochorismate synthase EntC